MDIVYAGSCGCCRKRKDDNDDDRSVSTNSSDMSWDDFGAEKRRELELRGWNRDAWDGDDPTLMSYYNEVELYWNQLPEDRKAYWRDLDYTEEKWDTEELTDHDRVDIKGDADAKPTVVKLALDDLCRFDISHFENLDGDKAVKVSDGTSYGADESPTGTVGLKDFLSHLRRGSTEYYFKVEDEDRDKGLFAEVGRTVVESVSRGLAASELGGSDGPFKPEWQTMDPDDFSWSIWMGAKGTITGMHFDTELFNFLYVVEGKKRVVLIPNDHRTDNMFKIKSFYSGSAWTGIDVLSKDFVLPEGSVDVEVGPGEGIVIPFRWWHSVENLEDTLAYGFRVTG